MQTLIDAAWRACAQVVAAALSRLRGSRVGVAIFGPVRPRR